MAAETVAGLLLVVIVGVPCGSKLRSDIRYERMVYKQPSRFSAVTISATLDFFVFSVFHIMDRFSVRGVDVYSIV